MLIYPLHADEEDCIWLNEFWSTVARILAQWLQSLFVPKEQA